MDLFAVKEAQQIARQAPLATRMRPRSLDEFVGQQHFLGPGQLLRRSLDAGKVTSAIFYGPPGTGKTTLAHCIANQTQSEFRPVNATAAGVKELREVIDQAKVRLATGQGKTVLFVDEIHRFNRAQQDVLLPEVEAGAVILLGATTENPFFAVNSPLISRSQVFRFEPLNEDDIKTLLVRALSDPDRGLGTHRATIAPAALDFLAKRSDGDARRALNALEIAVLSQEPGDRSQASGVAENLASPALPKSPDCPIARSSEFQTGNEQPAMGNPHITLAVAEQSMQLKALVYDGTGDEHYDIVSAFIKSMRGSDPDATVYWLARMLEAGEDPRFIARRIAILASEDIGNADPRAILVASAAFDIVEKVGLPEGQLTLAHAAIYMACAPKSNACAAALWKAGADVREGKTVPVPASLRDAHYSGAKKMGHGEGYVYPHTTGEIPPAGSMGVQEVYYRPTGHGAEAVLKDWLEKRRQAGKAE